LEFIPHPDNVIYAVFSLFKNAPSKDSIYQRKPDLLKIRLEPLYGVDFSLSAKKIGNSGTKRPLVVLRHQRKPDPG
jgi:hypothetical protein